ncbi:MAG TPA: transglutaminaseTgpA domain-containing protein [Candidatus Dormibacteraeota bacterium]
MAAVTRLHKLSRLPRIPESPVEDSALARFFAWAGFAVAGASIAIYGGDLVVAPATVAVGALGHAVSYGRRQRPRGTLRQAVLAGLVFACLVYFLADSGFAVFGGELPQAHFALLLLAVTAFDLKTRRNLYSSLWISLAVFYLAAVYAWDYPFGVFAGVWACCLAGFWTASHLRQIDAVPRVPARATALGVSGALISGVLVFALLPQPTAQPDSPLVISLPAATQFRGEVENPALPLVEIGGQSGANTSVDLRYRGRLGSAVVMYVRTGAPAYWRGLVFDRYQGGAWTASLVDDQLYPPYVSEHRLPPPLGPQLGTFVQVFRPARTLPGVIYAAAPVRSIYFPAGEILRDPYGGWRAPGAIAAGQTYSVVSSLPDYTPASLERSEGLDDLTAIDHDATALSSAARGLARQAVAGAGASRYEQVMALTSYLQSNYRYTLQLGHVPAGRDPVDWFLFDAREGYCEQFATAETLMLRSLGIPARLATGYATGTYDPVLNQAVVHESDAHAWVEVYFPGHGWVPVDPSPGYSPLAATRFPDRLAASEIAHLIPHLTLGSFGIVTSLGALAILPAAGLLAALALLAAAWAVRGRRPWRRAGEADLFRLYRLAQRRAGTRRGPPETPREYAARVPDSLRPLVAEVTDAVERGAYAGRWPSRDEVSRLRAKLRER